MLATMAWTINNEEDSMVQNLGCPGVNNLNKNESKNKTNEEKTLKEKDLLNIIWV